MIKELKTLGKRNIISQEDRRLFFVAMTRAKKELIFTRPAGKENKPYIDSPFIVETGIQPSPQPSPLREKELEQDISRILKNQLVGDKKELIKIGNEEINYISEFLENYKLSPTDLNTFLEDPKEFLKNVVFKYPFTGNEFTIFGNVYHRVLELATMKKMTGEKVELGYMTETFLFLLSKQILTAEERDRLTKKGLEGLTGYFEIFNNNPKRIISSRIQF
ncbi:MAG: 3'-5' exonuclease [Candidatus Gracilibacteria bacterium]|nr:3'-5' exonuclease [Candidatus Gracilibacteria bacterium]